MSKERKGQTNLKLSPASVVALDAASAVERQDNAQIVEEALQLREELMGSDYSDLIQAALTARFSDSPEERLAAIESLRDEVEEATPDGSVSVAAAIAKTRARSRQPA